MFDEINARKVDSLQAQLTTFSSSQTTFNNEKKDEISTIHSNLETSKSKQIELEQSVQALKDSSKNRYDVQANLLETVANIQKSINSSEVDTDKLK